MYSVYNLNTEHVLTFASKTDLLAWAKDKCLYSYKIYKMFEVNIETRITFADQAMTKFYPEEEE